MQSVTKAVDCTCRYKSFNKIPPNEIHYYKVSSISDGHRLKYLFTAFNATCTLQNFINRTSLSMQAIDSMLKFEQMRWNKIGVRMISSQKNIVSRNLFMTQTITRVISQSFFWLLSQREGALVCWRLTSVFTPETTLNNSHRLFISASHDTLATFCGVVILLSLPEPTQGHQLARAGVWRMDKNFKTFPF